MPDELKLEVSLRLADQLKIEPNKLSRDIKSSGASLLEILKSEFPNSAPLLSDETALQPGLLVFVDGKPILGNDVKLDRLVPKNSIELTCALSGG